MPHCYKSGYATPEPAEEVKTVEHRFKMPALPALTIVQFILLAFIVYHAWTTRKMKNPVLGTAIVAYALLHLYDHLYRVKRGPEHLFFLPKKEAYKCCGN
jgi:L-asparagine transporter-like permease